jgi:hypothetical protein
MFILLIAGLLTVPTVKANDTSLSITPDKCVALRKGQVCYQTLRIKFIASTIGDYCLKIVDQPTPLQCWKQVNAADHRHALASNQAVEFEVVDDDLSTVATARVTIAWVYKQSRSRNRWRLF